MKWISHRVENCKLMWNLALHCKIYTWTQWVPHLSYGRAPSPRN